MLTRMAQESGIETPTVEDLVRLDRKRKGKKLSYADWQSPTDPDARIAKLKDGRLSPPPPRLTAIAGVPAWSWRAPTMPPSW
jgi:hypothetical protein